MPLSSCVVNMIRYSKLEAFVGSNMKTRKSARERRREKKGLNAATLFLHFHLPVSLSDSRSQTRQHGHRHRHRHQRGARRQQHTRWRRWDMQRAYLICQGGRWTIRSSSTFSATMSEISADSATHASRAPSLSALTRTASGCWNRKSECRVCPSLVCSRH